MDYSYICIEGNIGAGKTTLTKQLVADWNAYPIFEQFTDNPFLPLFYQDPERYGFQVELFFMIERHKQLEQIKPGKNLFDELYLADYFFHKTMLFARQNLETEDYKLFSTIFNTLEGIAPKPDLLVYLHRPVEVLLQLINKRDREMEHDISAEYLTNIQDSYLEYLRGIIHMPVLILNLEDKDFEKDVDAYQTIKRSIEQKYQPGVHYLSI